MQRWIMTVKDHSTGLVYLCALPQKKAIYVAVELEKYFGLIGYPEIFHTGMFTFSLMLSGANRDRYAALKIDLHNQYGYGKDLYPN